MTFRRGYGYYLKIYYVSAWSTQQKTLQSEEHVQK